MDNHAEKYGSRSETRKRIVAVFNRLLLEGASPRPGVAQLIAEAGVSRSTFYDHFDGIEALSHESLAALFSALADNLVSSASGKDDALIPLLEHVWQNRALGRDLLTGDRGQRSEALLANVLEERLTVVAERRLSAILIAGTVMSALSGWATGKISTSPREMAPILRRTAESILADR